MDDSRLEVSLLGGCSISCAGRAIDTDALHSKKIWQLLGFLITYRHREVTRSELLGAVYAEDASANPTNALKTLMHRVRASLDALGGPGGKNIILQREGGYCWNNALNTRVDTEEFDALFAAAQAEEDADRGLELRLRAIKLYRGDYMPKFAMESWVLPIYIYYHSRYMQLVHEAVERLSQKGEYDEAVDVCYAAIAIEPFDDSLYCRLIKALVNLGQNQAALSQYEKTKKLFFSEFGVTPSEELQALYRETLKSTHSVETDISEVKRKLYQDEDGGAFFCEYEIFKDIYNVAVRAAARTGKPMHVCLLTAGSAEGRALSAKAMDGAMNRLIESVRRSLRRGDCFARYSVSQLILLLPLNTNETVERVLRRLARNFKTEYPRSPIALDYSFQPVDAIIR